MELIRFVTEEHEIAGAYPSGMINQLSGNGCSLRIRNNCMKDHRDLIDRVVTGLEAQMLHCRACHAEFEQCRDLSDAEPVVRANLKAYLLKNHPGHDMHRNSFNGIIYKVTTSLWDVWKNDEAERS